MLIVNEYSNINSNLEKAWHKLWEQSSYKTFFNSYEWFKICLQTFKYSKSLIIVVEENDELVAILPLIKNKNYFVSPGENYLDSTTLLVKSNYKEAILAIQNYIRKNKYQVILKEVNESLIEYFDKVSIQFASNNPQANLDKGIENIIKHKELRYLKRIKEKYINFLDFEIISGSMCNTEINRIFKIEKSSSKPKLKRDIFKNQDARDLFKNISTKDNSLLIILKYNDLDIAHLFSVKCDKTIMAYHMAYNSDYSYLQPGKLIFLELMDYMLSNDLKTLDFSRGDSILKRHFSNDNIKKYNLYISCNMFIRIKVIVNNLTYKIKNTKVYLQIKKVIKGK